jgi:predicted CopG family antitoxin
MFKTITIKGSVFKRLSFYKSENESFSDLFERLMDNQVSGLDTLRKLTGSINISNRLEKGADT